METVQQDGSGVAVGSGVNDAGDGLGESVLEEQNDAAFVDVVGGPKGAVSSCDPESESSATCRLTYSHRASKIEVGATLRDRVVSCRESARSYPARSSFASSLFQASGGVAQVVRATVS